MKIFIDTRPVAGKPAGIGQYVKRLVTTFAKVDQKRSDLSVSEIGSRAEDQFYLLGGKIDGLPQNFHQKELIGKKQGFYNRLWRKAAFPKIESFFNRDCFARARNDSHFSSSRGREAAAIPSDLAHKHFYFDLAHFTNFEILPNKAKKIITSIYDLSFIRYPEFGDPKTMAYLKKIVPQSIKKSDLILTISEFSKKEIVEYYGVAPDKVKIIYLAADELFFSQENPEAISAVKSKYDLSSPYIMTAATIEPRKNLFSLIDAFGQLKDKDTKLLIVGKKDWQKQIFKAAERHLDPKIKQGVRFTGYVSDKELKLLLAGSQLFVFPSLYEGFGLPPLEAMAVGVPVAMANVASLPEVGGDAALYFDPKNIGEIARAMEKILGDQELSKDLIQKGKVQAQKFSWDLTARQTLATYKSLFND